MIPGQRRGLAVRNASQLNVEAQKVVEKKPLVGVKRPISASSECAVDLKKPAVIQSTNAPVRKKAYGGDKFMVPVQLVSDIDTHLRRVEWTRKLDSDFLKGTAIDGRTRTILIDWLVQIQAKFQLSAESFYMSCCLVDRIIKPMAVTLKNFQLFGLACILIASKFEEVMIPNVHDFVYMGGGFCTTKALFEAERNVLRALEFEMSFAYPSYFLRKLRFFMPSALSAESVIVYDISKILVDVAILDHMTAWWMPSEIAATAIHLAYKFVRKTCPTGLTDVVNVSSNNASRKADILSSRIFTYLDPTSSFKGLRLKYRGSEALRRLDEASQQVRTS